MSVAPFFDPFLHADFWIGVAVVAGIYGIFTLGLQLNVGFTGILNFGQAGFMAIGAYTGAALTVYGQHRFLPPLADAPPLTQSGALLLALLAGGSAAALMGLVVGLLAFGTIGAIAGALSWVMFSAYSGSWDRTMGQVAVALATGLAGWAGGFLGAAEGAKAGWRNQPLLSTILSRSWSGFCDSLSRMR